MKGKSNILYLAWATLYDLPVVILLGNPGEKVEALRERALDTIYLLGADDDTKDELRKTLEVSLRLTFCVHQLGYTGYPHSIPRSTQTKKDEQPVVQEQNSRHSPIKRRERNPEELGGAQRGLAKSLSSKYKISFEHAARYLDWYLALSRGWISQEQFETEMKEMAK